jgi:hypothetical protein
LKTDGAGNLTWTNGANSTVLAKSSTGIAEFATLNSVLQSGPVDLGGQWLTTTGEITTGNIALTSATTASNVGSAGSASALPATPSGYIRISINGTPYKLPYYSV